MTRPHGIPARYRHGPDENDRPGNGCRCTRCKKSVAKAANVRRLSVSAGTHRPMQDARPVREHVASLHAAGMPYTTIAARAGVAVVVVNRLMYGAPAKGEPPTRLLRPENAAALLAVRADSIGEDGYVLAVGSRRRLQALMRAGWPAPYLAPKAQLNPDYMKRLMRGATGPTVTAETAHRIREVFSGLWSVDPVAAGVPEGKSSQVRTLAERRGWLPPAAWDDDFIDLPDAELEAETSRQARWMTDEEVVRCHNAYYRENDRSPLTAAGAKEYRRRGKNKPQLDRSEPYWELRDLGLPLEEACERAGISTRTGERYESAGRRVAS